MTDERIITGRTITVEAFSDKPIDVRLGGDVIRAEYGSPFAGWNQATWTLHWPDDVTGLIGRLRDMKAAKMSVEVEVEGITFVLEDRRTALMNEPSLALLNPNIKAFHREMPYSELHRFDTLADFEAYALKDDQP